MKASRLVILLGIGLLTISCSEKRDVASTDGQLCEACHAAMPPQDALHTAHVADHNFACQVCHDGYDSIMTNPATHANGQLDVTISLPFTVESDTLLNPTYTNGSCSQVYCHGGFSQGQAEPVAVAQSDTAGCALCHNIQAMLTEGHLLKDYDTYHPFPSIVENCSNCHQGYSITEGTVVDSTHIDGSVQYGGCDECHG